VLQQVDGVGITLHALSGRIRRVRERIGRNHSPHIFAGSGGFPFQGRAAVAADVDVTANLGGAIEHLLRAAHPARDFELPRSHCFFGGAGGFPPLDPARNTPRPLQPSSSRSSHQSLSSPNPGAAAVPTPLSLHQTAGSPSNPEESSDNRMAFSVVR